MHTVVNGTRYRLRFLHYFKPGKRGKKGKQGTTTCFVEMWSKREAGGGLSIEGWAPISSGMATCGRNEQGFYKEQGRQFSLIRALRQDFPEATNELRGALITAYVQSGKETTRMPCYDLFVRGYRSLYDAVFSNNWPTKLRLEVKYQYEGEHDAA